LFSARNNQGLRFSSASSNSSAIVALKSLTIVAALLATGTSLAMAQNGQPTGTYPPVAGGAGGNPITNPGYYGGYYATGAYRYAVPRRRG